MRLGTLLTSSLVAQDYYGEHANAYLEFGVPEKADSDDDF